MTLFGAREAFLGDGELISWNARFVRCPVFGAAFSTGLLGSFPLGFFDTVFGAASSFGAGPGFCAFGGRETAAAVGSEASVVCSDFEALVAVFLLGFARFVNSKSPSLLS